MSPRTSTMFCRAASDELAEVPVPNPSERCSTVLSSVVMGLLGTDPPDLTLESASPSPHSVDFFYKMFFFPFDLASIQHRFPESTLFRFQIDTWGGEGTADSKVGYGGPVPNKPLTSPALPRVVPHEIASECKCDAAVHVDVMSMWNN